MIKSIELVNYRNIKKINLNFEEDETIIIGKNGNGKTAILEAIYFLAIGKPFRGEAWEETIKFSEEFAQIKGKIDNNSEINDYFIGYANSPKKQIKYKISNIEKKAFDFIGNFHCVLFSPEDLQIITESPTLRRNFLNSILIRLDKNYAILLNNYLKILKQRNTLLKDIQSGKCHISLLEVWNDKFAEYGLVLEQKRIELVDKLKSRVLEYYKKISNKEDIMEIEFVTNSFGEKNISKDSFLEELNNKINKDIILGSTSIGPHRSDIHFFLNGSEMKSFASQGEIRSGILTLKYCEIELLKEKSNNITLLLDDVFSELDEERQRSLIELSKNFQTIITSTRTPEGYHNRKIYKIENGIVVN